MHIPVLITGTRRNDNAYERADWLPVEALGLGLTRQSDAFSGQDLFRQAKQEVLGRLQVLRTVNGRTVLMESSGEVCRLDRNRNFRIRS